MKRRGHFTNDPIKFLCIVVSIACTFVLCFSVLKLNEITQGNENVIGLKLKKNRLDGGRGIGKFGEIVIGMLPQDLGFTLFLPSEEAFERDLGLRLGENENENDTYAILTRVLGFSAVPRRIYADDVQVGKEINYDSISGYTVYISKESDGVLIVNRIASEMVDLRRGKIVVHVMDGVIMDPEFEQSVRPDDD
ncbi:hypothetical protein EJD97_013008 [Solanum chilense]|uniref:FAS1 domain-containing protein n=1 Tax=Solanum chilense TaxID=4083 RepID=A0A6N2BBY7_SOLCI|nr:hypothetical protein EJD97_013008 [Solanum chilense]